MLARWLTTVMVLCALCLAGISGCLATGGPRAEETGTKSDPEKPPSDPHGSAESDTVSVP